MFVYGGECMFCMIYFLVFYCVIVDGKVWLVMGFYNFYDGILVVVDYYI